MRRSLHYLPVIVIIHLTSINLQAQTGYLDSLLKSANREIENSKYATAIEVYQFVYTEALKQKDWLRTGNALNGIGMAYDDTGNFDNALKNYFNALRYYEASQNVKKQAGVLKNIGNTYRETRSYDKAEEYLKFSLVKYLSSHDSTGVAGVFNDMGNVFLDKDSITQAIKYYKKVTGPYMQYAREQVKAYALNNLGISYSKTGNYPESFAYYTASLQMMKKQNFPFGIALVNANIANLLNIRKEFENSIRYSKEALAIAQEIKSEETISHAYENLAESYLHLHQYRNAYNALHEHAKVKDTIFKQENTRSYAEMESKYQNEKKQKEIVLWQKKNAIDKIELATQQRTKYLLLLVVFFSLLTAMLLYRSYLLKRRSNSQLNLLNGELKEANLSKNKLFSILSHDLRSPISSLFSFLQLQRLSPGHFSKEEQEEHNARICVAATNVLEAIEDILIWSKSQMQQFSPVYEEINVSDFFEDIINLNSMTASTRDICLRKECPPDLTICTDPNFLKIIVRNLTSNALKFTPQQGTIHLVACRKDNNLQLVIKDTGPGIGTNELETIFDWHSIRSNSYGLGLKLAKEFTEKLNGSITVQSEQNKGSQFILFLPLHKEKLHSGTYTSHIRS